MKLLLWNFGSWSNHLTPLLNFARTTHPRPRHLRQSMAGAEASSPVPRHTGQTTVGAAGLVTDPLPPQVVQVRVFMAPVPRQCAQAATGEQILTLPPPLQTQQVDTADITSNGSTPFPLQKAQGSSTEIAVLRAELDRFICIHYHSPSPAVSKYFFPSSVSFSSVSPWRLPYQTFHATSPSAQNL